MTYGLIWCSSAYAGEMDYGWVYYASRHQRSTPDYSNTVLLINARAQYSRVTVYYCYGGDPVTYPGDIGFWHNDFCNAVMFDGHVVSFPKKTLIQYIPGPGSYYFNVYGWNGGGTWTGGGSSEKAYGGGPLTLDPND
jgi:prepilin-type processing-associated H-X9-DG protein